MVFTDDYVNKIANELSVTKQDSLSLRQLLFQSHDGGLQLMDFTNKPVLNLQTKRKEKIDQDEASHT